MRLIKLALLISVISSCKGQSADNLKTSKDNNTLLWQVSGNGLTQNSYLFGTFHLLCKDDMHFSEQLKQAVKNANEVYMEMDMDDPSVMLGALTMMNMKDGKTLRDLYTPAEYNKLQTFFNDSLHMPMMMMESIKPMMLEALLYPKMLPCKKASGVEEELLQLAKQNKKEIQGLETMAFQASIFDSIPYKEQAAELLKAIDSLDKYKKEFTAMMNVYKNQEIKGIEKLINEDSFGADEGELLLDNRNRNWVGQLRTIMKKEAVFVAVGAGHLVGEKGLINLLRKEGYTVTPLDNK